MNFHEHTTPQMLERYSFLWSEVRLVIAAAALFLGGIPPAVKLNPFPVFYGLIGSLLVIAWIISGIVAAYLVYRWYQGGQRVFGGKDTKDVVAFFFMIVTGFNLGLAGLSGTNIGMTISSNRIVFAIAGALYLVVAYYLYRRWSASGQKLFA